MSLKFPISLVGKRGSSITDGLVDWWDGGSSIGQFAGNDIGTMGADTFEHPTTFDGSWNWTVNKASFFSGLGCKFTAEGGKQTLGFVIRKKDDYLNSFVVQAGNNGTCRLTFTTDGDTCATTYFNTNTNSSLKYIGVGNWVLVLYQWDASDLTGQTFFNDNLIVYPHAPTNGGGPISRIGYNYGASIELAQIIYWNRWMTQDDADLLYNGGNFVKYSDL